MMKRITAVLLAVAMLLSMAMVASAENEVTVTVGNVQGLIGDIVEVPVSISEGHYLVNGRIFLNYDPTVMELQKVCEDEDYPYFNADKADWLNNAYNWDFFVPAPGRANLIMVTADDVGSTAGGTIYTLTFKLLKNVKDGAVTVTVPEMRSNNGGEDFDTNPTIVNGSVKVDCRKGDANGDTEIDLYDAILVFYHIGLKMQISPMYQPNADLDEDGKITLYDAVTLFHYVSGCGTL